MAIPAMAVGDTSGFFGAIGSLQEMVAEVLSHSDLRQDPKPFLPSSDSKAMAELDEEHKYVDPDTRDRPILNTYSKATMFMIAAEDHLDSLARLFAPPDVVSLFTPPVVLRSLLETLGRVQWLVDTGIGPKRRVARGLTESLNLHHQQRQMFKGRVRDEYDKAFNVQGLLQSAASMGFTIGHSKGGEKWLGDERRPGTNKAIERLFRGAVTEHVSGNLFRQTSAVTHASLHGVLASMSAAPSTDGLSPDVATFGVKSDEVRQILGVGIYAYVLVASERRRLMGWTTSDWLATEARASELLVQVFD